MAGTALKFCQFARVSTKTPQVSRHIRQFLLPTIQVRWGERRSLSFLTTCHVRGLTRNNVRQRNILIYGKGIRFESSVAASQITLDVISAANSGSDLSLASTTVTPVHANVSTNLPGGSVTPAGTNVASSISSSPLQTGTTTDTNFASSAVENLPIEPEFVIPDPPVPPVDEIASALAAGLEPSFASLGLGGWSPVGMIQSSLEFLHVSCNLPWWGAIAVGTAFVRFCLFPIVIIAQRNSANMTNNLPQMQILQMKMTDARKRGNAYEAAKLSNDLLVFMKEKNINPLKNLIVPFMQAPIFVSIFMGLRGMANLPVESMKTGGFSWVTDLTVADPFYILPLVTSLTLWATIEVGTDAARLNSANLGVMKYVLRAMPVVIFPFTLHFPGAVLCYWVTTNFASLAQVTFLRIPKVRDYCKIPEMAKYKPGDLPAKEKGFVEGVKDNWTNMKITRELEDRQRFDDMRFRQAGTGPLRKTYKYDPTKAVSAKKP